MKLKVFLLIAFVINVTSLNVEKDQSALVELFADVTPMRINESVESLKKDPSSFVELFAGANPEVINQVIGLLDTLVTEADSSLKSLEDRVTETLNSFNTANNGLVTAQDTLKAANAAKTNAEDVKAAAEDKHRLAQVDKDTAENNYNDQSPNLIEEKRILQEVIEKLRSLNVNIALGASVTSSSEGWNGTASKVTDGKHNNNKYVDAPSGVCAHTRKEPSWIKVLLPQEVVVGQILLAGRKDCCHEQSSGWTIHVGNNGDESDPICRSNVDASAIGKVEVFTPVQCDSILSGRYITIFSGTWMVLCEIEVYEGI